MVPFAFDTGTMAVNGSIGASGAVTGVVIASGLPPGAGTAAKLGDLAGTRDTSGSSSALAGYYQLGASNAAATESVIVGADGRALAVTQSGANLDAATGTVDASGKLAANLTGGATFAATLAGDASSATGTYTPASGAAVALAGAGDLLAPNQRFREFSARARVDAANPLVLGFIVAGDTPDSMLVRAIGPTLADAFAVSGALTNPRIDLYRGSTVMASNANWTTNNAIDVATTSSQVGAFPLRTPFADSALRLTLNPGAYSAVVSSASGDTAGIALGEVFDVGFGSAGQRLINLSVRGAAGTGANVLTAGFFISGTQPKRLLIRGVGPSLSAYGVTNALARPALTLYRGTTLVASNTGWSTSPDVAAITAAATEVRAFALATGSADSAMVINLPPGLYSVQVNSPDNSTGTALIELYELP